MKFILNRVLLPDREAAVCKKLPVCGSMKVSKPISRFYIVETMIVCLGVLVMFASCNKDEKKAQQSVPYNPAIPIRIDQVLPDSGVIRTKVVIKGSNFGNDKSLVSVYFIDKDKLRKATIVGLNNETIYCLAPKQNGGANKVMVKIKEDSTTAAKTFFYTVSQSLSNVVGVTGDPRSVDGSLADGRIQRTFGIAALGDDQVMTFELITSTVRYISVNDNKIYTVQTGFAAGQPALNKARTVAYAIQSTSPHKVIRYRKENLWAPEILTAGIYRKTGTVVAGVIVSAALDATEKWLYFRDKSGVFGRLEIDNPLNVEILNETCGAVGTADYNYLAYSAVEDCFYFGIQNTHSIYRVEKDGTNVQLWSGSSQGSADGPRLEAKYNSPGGLAIDSEGNILVMDTNNHTVRMINYASGYVSRIAGIVGSSGFSNGEPLLSAMSFPYCINADERDNYFIGESWGVTIRKLAIE